MDERVAVDGREVHRVGCVLVHERMTLLEAGTVIDRDVAPRACDECRPRFEMLLPGE